MNENEKKTNTDELLKNAPKYPERVQDLSAIQQQSIDKNADAASQIPLAMATYAGPDMMNRGMFFPVGYAPAMPQQPVVPDGIVCEICGYINKKGYKFCTECGHKLDGTGSDKP